MIRMAGGTL